MILAQIFILFVALFPRPEKIDTGRETYKEERIIKLTPVEICKHEVDVVQCLKELHEQRRANEIKYCLLYTSPSPRD